MAPSLQAPSTPAKQRIWSVEEPRRDFDKWFLSFSNKYCLQLSLPDPRLSPSKLAALSDPNIKISERLRVHYWRRTHADVQDRFDRDARQLLRKWVKKPRDEPDVTPRPARLPAAHSDSERIELLGLLTRILNEHDPRTPSNSQPQPASLRTTTAAPQSPLTSRQRSKRPSEDGYDASTTKRPKSAASESPNEDDESTFVKSSRAREMFKRPPRSHASNQGHFNNGLKKSFYDLSESAATSKFSLASAVFDHDGHDEPQTSQETQTTVEAEAPIQEKEKRPRAVEFMSDNLYPSSGTEFALQTSFNKIMARREGGGSQGMTDSSSVMETMNTYSEFSFPPEEKLIREDHGQTPTSSPSKLSKTKAKVMDIDEFKEELRVPWRSLPPSFHRAPLGLRWELLRVFLHCGVDPMSAGLIYDSSWMHYGRDQDQGTLWERLRAMPALQGRTLPERSDPHAWAASLGNFWDGERVVVLSAILSTDLPGPGESIFQLRLNPLKLEQPHRLARRFGPDRFLDLLIPWPDSYKAPEPIKSLGEHGKAAIIEWLTADAHVILGRTWASFFVRKGPESKEERKDVTLVPEPVSKGVPRERVYLFAENGEDFTFTPCLSTRALQLAKTAGGDTPNMPFTRAELLEWHINVSENQEQAELKLFSRISLGLSRTRAAVVVKTHQIRHRGTDILSPAGKVMNDGIARASPAFFRAVRDHLGLPYIPCAFQGRFGSAKGMWIRDTNEEEDGIWIETFPSQRKWICDYLDEDHRTFEVRNMATELRSANLNLQLLPILATQSSDPEEMKRVVGKYLQDGLQRDIDNQKSAMSDPVQLRNWIHEAFAPARRQARVHNGEVPWRGGLPVSDEERMTCLLDSGFHPGKLKYLQDMAYNLRRQKCTELMNRMNVKIGRSTYAYMVVDFLGVLDEGEVHLGFSSKFEDEQSGFHDTMLHNMEVLVTRSPAHYVSDVQRVRAVFKPELASLKDVIVFSTRGDSPLADILSGGDYDGDMAWVCWEPSIVQLFQNAKMPQTPDLFQQGILRKVKTTYHEIATGSREETTARFLYDAFNFNMNQDLLGICTNWKEKLCYHRQSVSDEKAVILSTLIAHLVDRAKQGIVFTNSDWNQFREKLVGPKGPKLKDPWYKKDSWGSNGTPRHIIDYLKFSIGQPTVQAALDSFNQDINRRTSFKQDKEEGAQDWDPDLTKLYHCFDSKRQAKPVAGRSSASVPLARPGTFDVLLDRLHKDIDDVRNLWSTTQDCSFDAKVMTTYDRYRAIAPDSRLVNKGGSKTIAVLTALSPGPFSTFELLKASMLFKKHYKNPAFVWHTAGQELCYLKALAVSSSSSYARPVLVIPGMYAALRPDKVYARQLAAKEPGLMGGERGGGPFDNNDGGSNSDYDADDA